MNLLDTINAIIVSIGLPIIIGCSIYIGKKLSLLETLKDTTEKIKNNVKVISDYLTKYQTKFDPKELKAYSPLTLTELGSKLIKEIGFDNVFGEHKSDFFRFIDGEHPRLKYDVETIAIKSIYTLAERPYMSFLKIYFYNNPSRNMENTAPTLGVYVRDKYLAEHPEITQ